MQILFAVHVFVNPTVRKLLLALCGVPLIGCTPTVRPYEAAYPVDGQLLAGGKSAAGAKVTFHRIENEHPIAVTAVVKDDGHFVPVRPDGAIGLPEGQYALTAVWDVDGTDRFEGRYSDRNAPIATVTIRNDVNLLEPIRLP